MKKPSGPLSESVNAAQSEASFQTSAIEVLVRRCVGFVSLRLVRLSYL